jgi:HEAT repeat protein
MSNFSQKLIIAVTAVLIVSSGLWYLNRRWAAQDPTQMKVDPDVELRIRELLEQSKTAKYYENASMLVEINDMGRQAMPVLLQALNDDDPRVRAFAVNALQYSDSIYVIPHLRGRLADNDPIVRRTALAALGTMQAVDAIPAVILVLDDSDDFTRCQAALVLGILGEEGAVPSLLDTLREDPYPVARQTAANSLGKIGSEKAVPALIDSLHDNDYLVRSASLVALNEITDAGLGPNKDDWIRWWNQKRHELSR